MSELLTTHPAEHARLWNDRLQDWLDGGATSPDDAAFEAHLADCPLCQAELAAFTQLDGSLHTAAPPLALTAAFDARLFSQIDALDASSHQQASQRLEQELQANLQVLGRRWRQNLAFVLSGAAAGAAVAAALVGWFDSSGLSRQLLIAGTHEFGHHAGTYLEVFVTALLGAGIGLAVANWLAAE